MPISKTLIWGEKTGEPEDREMETYEKLAKNITKGDDSIYNILPLK